jgi:hypothetical protein
LNLLLLLLLLLNLLLLLLSNLLQEAGHISCPPSLPAAHV